MEYAPIILFVYNRPGHTQKTIDALKGNILSSESELYIFSDAPKNNKSEYPVNQVRQYIKGVKGFKNLEIITREKNLGLANSIIDGVSSIIKECGRAIVLEDDLITAPYFLNFMNKALYNLEGNSRIGSVSGYSYLNYNEIYNVCNGDVYLSRRHSSWGWGTWANIWDMIDWSLKDYNSFQQDQLKRENFNLGGGDLSLQLDMQMQGRLDSWAIRFGYNCFKNGLHCALPVKSLIKNIGFDGSGIHCEKTSEYDIVLDPNFGHNLQVNQICSNSIIDNLIKSKFDKIVNSKKDVSIFNKIINKLKELRPLTNLSFI
jgi:hypothetical protein